MLMIGTGKYEKSDGKQIVEGIRGNAPHKSAFYNRTPEEYAAILQGKTVGEAREHGSLILMPSSRSMC